MKTSGQNVAVQENIWAKSGCAKIWESPKQKLLGVVTDRKLKFNEYVSSLCRKAGKKLSAVTRLSHYMRLKQESFNIIHYNVIANWFGCFILDNSIEKLSIFTNVHYELSTETTVALSQNFLKKITRSVFTVKTSNLKVSNCTK